MILEYCQKALEIAEYKKLEDGTWFAEIPGFRGVWANAATVEECRKELFSVLEELIILKLRDKEAVPDVDGLKVEITDPLLNEILHQAGISKEEWKRV